MMTASVLSGSVVVTDSVNAAPRGPTKAGSLIDLATYFFVCWQYAQDAANSAATDAERAKGLGALARAANVSEKYTMRVWELLHEAEAWGPTARLQAMFRELSGGDELH